MNNFTEAKKEKKSFFRLPDRLWIFFLFIDKDFLWFSN